MTQPFIYTEREKLPENFALNINQDELIDWLVVSQNLEVLTDISSFLQITMEGIGISDRKRFLVIDVFGLDENRHIGSFALKEEDDNGYRLWHTYTGEDQHHQYNNPSCIASITAMGIEGEEESINVGL